MRRLLTSLTRLPRDIRAWAIRLPLSALDCIVAVALIMVLSRCLHLPWLAHTAQAMTTIPPRGQASTSFEARGTTYAAEGTHDPDREHEGLTIQFGPYTYTVRTCPPGEAPETCTRAPLGQHQGIVPAPDADASPPTRLTPDPEPHGIKDQEEQE